MLMCQMQNQSEVVQMVSRKEPQRNGGEIEVSSLVKRGFLFGKLKQR